MRDLDDVADELVTSGQWQDASHLVDAFHAEVFSVGAVGERSDDAAQRYAGRRFYGVTRQQHEHGCQSE